MQAGYNKNLAAARTLISKEISMTMQTKRIQRSFRHKRVRAKIMSLEVRPRLVVFRSNKHLYVQLIDDGKGEVIVSSSDMKIKSKKTGIEMAKEIGKLIGTKIKEHKIEKIVFDRGGYKYHGQIKALAEEIRALGIIF